MNPENSVIACGLRSSFRIPGTSNGTRIIVLAGIFSSVAQLFEAKARLIIN